ncbi:MAG: EAL domain-containing protein [Chloroflexi bacterium]|nr:EAL domain-containing protein [Chloroflexota bacterium]
MAKFLSDQNGTLLGVNRAAEELSGYSKEELTGKNFAELGLMHRDQVLVANELLARGRRGERTGPDELTLNRRDGTQVSLEITTFPLAIGNQPLILGLARNITDRKLAEEELRIARDELESQVKERIADLATANEQLRNEIAEREEAQKALQESEETFRGIIHSAPDAVVVVGADGCISLVNDQTETLFGYAEVEMIGQPIELLIPPTRRHSHIHKRDRFTAAPSRRPMSSDLDISARHKDGHTIPVEVSLSPLESRAGPAVVAMVRDITLRKEAEETIRHMAYHDALTGLPNRELLQDRLDVALAQARRIGNIVAVIYLDLDRFKNINDSLGHTAGDTLLQRVGRQLSNLVRHGDTVARIGGDEFVILLPGLTEVAQVIDVGERVLKRIGRRRTLLGQEILVTASLGISLFPADGDSVEDQLVHADTAMYRAKEAGRNRYEMYHSDMTANIEKRLVMEAELRHALEDGAIVPHFQPQLDVETGRLIGAEALARWHHPDRGIVLPDDFIQVAREAGLSLLLTERILRSASALHAEMRNKGLPPIRMAVNVGPAELRTNALPQIVARILAQSGMAPEHLQIEITEQEAMQDPDLAVEILTALRSTGVQIIVDDFGTGHSSLSYLQRFPVNGVKVDRSFIRDLEDNHDDAAIVSAIISMAKSLNLTVVAEGVETEGQLEFLKERGCDEYQGFLFSPAVPADEFKKLLKAHATGAKQAGARGRRPSPA